MAKVDPPAVPGYYTPHTSFVTDDRSILNGIEVFELKKGRDADKVDLWTLIVGIEEDGSFGSVCVSLFKIKDNEFRVECQRQNGDALLARDLIEEIMGKFAPRSDNK